MHSCLSLWKSMKIMLQECPMGLRLSDSTLADNRYGGFLSHRITPKPSSYDPHYGKPHETKVAVWHLGISWPRSLLQMNMGEAIGAWWKPETTRYQGAIGGRRRGRFSERKRRPREASWSHHGFTRLFLEISEIQPTLSDIYASVSGSFWLRIFFLSQNFILWEITTWIGKNHRSHWH
jgi:hypothetical protein